MSVYYRLGRVGVRKHWPHSKAFGLLLGPVNSPLSRQATEKSLSVARASGQAAAKAATADRRAASTTSTAVCVKLVGLFPGKRLIGPLRALALGKGQLTFNLS